MFDSLARNWDVHDMGHIIDTIPFFLYIGRPLIEVRE
jgi:hypothetical protein